MVLATYVGPAGPRGAIVEVSLAKNPYARQRVYVNRNTVLDDTGRPIDFSFPGEPSAAVAPGSAAGDGLPPSHATKAPCDPARGVPPSP